MGNKKNNIIEINGKRYDARTGESLGHHPPVKDVAVGHKPEPTQAIRPIAIRHETQTAPKPAKKTLVHDAALKARKPAKAHAPERSRTLMRSAVKKPSQSLKRRVKAHSQVGALVKQPSLKLAPKPSASRLDEQRLKHAAHVKRSQLVQRFNRSQIQPAIRVPVTVTKLAKTAAAKPIIIAKPTPIAPKQPQTTADLLQHALQHATSHEQKAPKLHNKRRLPPKSITSISAVVFAVAILAGFVGYSNLTNVRLKVASAKAGFTASLPGNAPAGYHLSHLNYSPGTVALNFQSNSDSRKFAIIEKASSWDSGTLRDTYVASSGQDYQTVESAGRTLYLLGQNAATWVSGGIWYQVKADGALSNHQLVSLASSM